MTAPLRNTLRQMVIRAVVTAAALGVVGCGGNTSTTDGAASSGGSGGGGAGGGGGRGGATSSGGAGGSSDAGATSACPNVRPVGGTICNVQETCRYAAGDCVCLDPGPNGTWQCAGSATDAGNPAGCPTDQPFTGDPCTTAVQNCQYGGETCECIPADGWSCLI